MAGSVKITDRTHEAVEKIRKLTYNGRKEFVEVAVELAKDKSPKDTTNNAELITHDEIDGGKKARMYTESGYGGYLELGTSRMAAQPYMAPSIQGAIRDFTDGRKWGG